LVAYSVPAFVTWIATPLIIEEAGGAQGELADFFLEVK